MHRIFLLVVVAFVVVSFRPISARADACAAAVEARAVIDPVTPCISTVVQPTCNGGVDVTFTNGCAVELVGIERQSSVQILPTGYPPLSACALAYQAAQDSGQMPPPCILAPGEVGNGFAQVGDTLFFELGGAPLTVKLEAMDAPADDSGCSVSSGANERGAFWFVPAFFVALVGWVVRRRGRYSR
jgi:hypothetical protein